MSKIAIVSDKITLLNTIQAKLILLRDDDVLLKSDVANVAKIALNADIILLHTPDLSQQTIDLITTLKKENNEIILLLESYNPKDLLRAYDSGICDFCSVDVTNFELLMKIINAKKSLKKQTSLNFLRKILSFKGVLKFNSGIFTNISDVINENNFALLRNSVIISVIIPTEFFDKVDVLALEECFPLRQNDIIINYDNFKYLLILPETKLENVKFVFDKIKISFDLPIKAIAFVYNEESANEIKNKVNRLETELDGLQQDLLLWEFKELEETEDDWLNPELSEEPKNYKIFQNIYSKKIESVIEPVFYRIKQKYEKSLKNTKIKYYTAIDRSEFLVVNFNRTCSLRIDFNNSAKLHIDFIFNGLEAPENEKYSVAFSDFTVRYLTDLLENFISKGEE